MVNIKNVEINVAQARLAATFLDGDEFKQLIMAVIDYVDEGVEPCGLNARQEPFFITLKNEANDRWKAYQRKIKNIADYNERRKSVENSK